MLHGVLFDLDGTFLDTAQDMAAALNVLRVEEGLAAMAFEDIRPEVSNGARGLLRVGFGIDREHAHFERLRVRYLEIYAAALHTHTRAFPGIDELIAILEARDIRWGIVTNKPRFLAEPLLDALAYLPRACCLIAGDDHTERKPLPGPLFLACERSGLKPESCIYVGDAARDIEAGRNAGMGTIAARYGYIPLGEDPADWRADAEVQQPHELWPLLENWSARR